MDQLALQDGIFLSKGVTKFLEKVDPHTQDVRLWSILWMFKNRFSKGFEENDITVIGVCGLDMGRQSIPLAVESHCELFHTIMLPEESKRLNMTSAQCARRLSKPTMKSFTIIPQGDDHV